GVRPDRVHRIFEPFYQVDGSVTREHGGVGVGLAIARRTARGLGGDVRVVSPSPETIEGLRLGGGAVFLPGPPARPARHRGPGPPAGGDAGGRGGADPASRGVRGAPRLAPRLAPVLEGGPPQPAVYEGGSRPQTTGYDGGSRPQTAGYDGGSPQ